jgi:hypothetical protein
MDERETQPAQAEKGSAPVSFSSLVLSLALGAMQLLGEPEKPEEKPRDYRQAKPLIDSLEILREKTRGNLTNDESALLDSVLHDLRLRYLKADSGKPTAEPARAPDDKPVAPGDD